jgi:two-component system OmpR family sensor kinase
MGTLRARIIASVLVLAAAGLVALALVTYTEQRSFLIGRLNQEAEGAGPAISHALDQDDAEDQGDEAQQGNGGGQAGAVARRGPTNGPPSLNLPPGTYGQSRDMSGKVIGHVFISYGQANPPAPVIPARVPLNRLITVGSVGSSGLRYRVYASRDVDGGSITVVAVPLREVDQTLSHLLLVEALVIAGVLVALAVTASFVVRLGLRPLDRMEATAGAIAGGELSRRVSPADASTEVGRLGLALNAMLDRLEQAFAAREASEERLRQFLADASHELRTPLASIRGYAELFRIGATVDEEGTRTAMRRIEDESKRMGVLVEDLLTLARLDEEPELRRTQVDLVELAGDVVADARATAPGRAIALDAPESALVWGDAHQLHQVLANLMRNALVHTPADTAIEVSVRDEDGDVRMSVRDHGPGLPAGSHERLFERFWRAEGGRERGKAGAGLGLAIAREIVAAHRGTINAEDADGGGAAFVVRLPKSAPPATPPSN